MRFSASRQHIFSGCPVSGLCTASSSPFPQQQWAVSPVVTSVVSWPQSSPGAHCCHSWTEERPPPPPPPSRRTSAVYRLASVQISSLAAQQCPGPAHPATVCNCLTVLQHQASRAAVRCRDKQSAILHIFCNIQDKIR